MHKFEIPEMFEITPIFFDPILMANRFINKKGEHPPLFLIIHGNEIVLSENELTEDNWLFRLEKESERTMVEKQINTLIFNKEGTIITK